MHITDDPTIGLRCGSQVRTHFSEAEYLMYRPPDTRSHFFEQTIFHELFSHGFL